MRDEEKPFVCTKNGISFNIMPRNRAGWFYLSLWILLALVLALLFGWVMEGAEVTSLASIMVIVAFALAMTVWAVAIGRWMYVRSEIIDVRELTEKKRRRDGGKP